LLLIPGSSVDLDLFLFLPSTFRRPISDRTGIRCSGGHPQARQQPAYQEKVNGDKDQYLEHGTIPGQGFIIGSLSADLLSQNPNPY